jgi:uncharacterized membrane protein YagU involved in acid resistance
MRDKISATVLGGLAAGFLDEMAALASHSAPRIHMLQYQASGLIGPAAAFAGGWASALLGVGIHFSLTTLMAGIFVIAAQRFPIVLRQPWCSGPAYGILLYLVMSYIVVPLSAAPNWKPAQGWGVVGSLLGHCLYVGLPIAAISRALLTDLPASVLARASQGELSPR